MLGLVASMGIASALTQEGATTSPPVGTSPAATPQLATHPITTPQIALPLPAAVAGSTPTIELAPMTLTARPDVRMVAPPAAQAAAPAPSPVPAPAATTRGSN